MATVLTFPALDAWRIGVQDVWLREHWDADWERVPFLHCDSATWCAAPSMPTATLSWVYGHLARENAAVWATVLKQSGVLRRFVRIDFELEFKADLGAGLPGFTHRTWYGVLEIDEDFLGGGLIRPAAGGGVTTIATGEQRLVCYGLEKLLQDQRVDNSLWSDADGVLRNIDRALDFNPAGRPNRAADPVGGVYHFGNDPATVKHWATEQIVRYLLSYQVPQNRFGLTVVPWTYVPGAPSIAPDWDQPELQAAGVSTYDLLEQLLPRQRLVSWYVAVNALTNEVEVRPFTFTEADIGVLLPGGKPIPANLRQFDLVFESDRSADVAIKTSSVDRCDQVLIRGARRRSCFTVSFIAGTLKIGWTGPEQASYELAGSTAPGYPPAEEVEERERWHAERRTCDQLSRVFSRFELNIWHGRAGPSAADPILFPLNPFPPYTLDMELEPTLPLLVGVDYAGDVVARFAVDETTATTSRDEVPLLVAWRMAGASGYVQVEKLGQLADLEETSDEQNHRWSASVYVVPHSAAFELRVHGQPQHVIASTDFTPDVRRPEDDDLGDHDFRQMLVTVSVRDNGYCEARWPDPPPMAVGVDAVRVMLLDAGEGYKQDFLVIDTVVAVNESTGELVRSEGGYLRDDTSLLFAAAKVAYSWYGRERAVLEFSTHQLTSELFVGDLIVEIGQPGLAGGHKRTLNTVVTEVQIQWPRAVDSPPQPPSMMFITQAGQLDALRLIGGGGGPVRGDIPVVLPRRPIKL